MKLGKRCRTVQQAGYTNYYHSDGWLLKYVYDNSLNQRWLDSLQRYHREDGPAVIYENGDKAWYLHGCCYPTEQLYNEALLKLKAKQDVIASNIASIK